ncbi:amidohydrolase family protein [Methylocaldum sp.]|uniref:amidohydrolase family protein n=1 Tax=Methylocaldum sp. TaxID=1969727 RepID=UPI002D2E587F|nr:amidohydrolase family protein [Methylocaldum sp.]HYE36681.1 amidohydrolase family protein [Methylocaldum sp.]
MAHIDPEGRRLPIKLDTATNGEYLPMPLSEPVHMAKRLAHDQVSEVARRLGITRRAFLKSVSGAAATLLAMNRAFAASGRTGGRYEIAPEAVYEPELAEAALGGKEFIFDIQGHHVNPNGQWRRPTNRWTYSLRFFPQADCGDGAIECFSAEHFIREVFLDSDTTMAVLSAVPAAPGDDPLSTEEAAATRATVDAMQDSHRLLIHGLVRPNLPGEIDAMSMQKERYGVAAWKTYTQWGPSGKGYWLDDPNVGIPFIEKARSLGVKVICIHKGLPLFGLDYTHSTCRDIGVVAKRFPDVAFIAYHSGYEPKRKEGPYDPANASAGVDSLVKTIQDNGIPPNSNIYAELGSTWKLLMRDPDQAAHVLGKLFKYVGESNVLWGTDSIWYGSPQDQIQAFRAFRIAETLRERHGYPEITPELRAKVFGLNAAKPYGVSPEEIRRRTASDRVANVKRAYSEDPEPSFATYGPKTRREFFELLRLRGGPL